MPNSRKEFPQTSTPEREEFYGRIREHAMKPLWEQVDAVVTPEPVIKAQPYIWKHQTYLPLLLESGDLAPMDKTERRVLVLENPGLDGKLIATDDLYAGLQLIHPGENAWNHRHNISALRFIIEGTGGFTRVEGEKTYMHPGDFIITRNWAWHNHGHEGEGPVIWLDGLDLPIALALGTCFLERDQAPEGSDARPAGDADARYAANMRPVGDTHDDPASPILNYPYERTRESLEALQGTTDWDPYFGLKMEYIDPKSGGPAMPTMSTFMQLLPKGYKTELYQATEGTVYSVVEGQGRTVIGEGAGAVTLDWAEKDVFVVPHWMAHRFEADSDAVLFSFSDKAAQVKLGLWREKRGNS